LSELDELLKALEYKPEPSGIIIKRGIGTQMQTEQDISEVNIPDLPFISNWLLDMAEVARKGVFIVQAAPDSLTNYACVIMIVWQLAHDLKANIEQNLIQRRK
jgi:hypothetical protein